MTPGDSWSPTQIQDVACSGQSRGWLQSSQTWSTPAGRAPGVPGSGGARSSSPQVTSTCRHSLCTGPGEELSSGFRSRFILRPCARRHVPGQSFLNSKRLKTPCICIGRARFADSQEGAPQDSYPSPGAAAAGHHTTAAANSAIDSLRLCRSEGWWAQLGRLLKLRGHQHGSYGGSGKKAPPACAGCAQDPGPCWPWSEGVPSTSGSGLCLHLQSQQKRWGLSHTWSLLVSPSCLWRCPRSSLLLKVYVTWSPPGNSEYSSYLSVYGLSAICRFPLPWCGRARVNRIQPSGVGGLPPTDAGQLSLE